MESRPGLYATLAFVAGVLVTLGFKDVYPDLERKFQQRRTVQDIAAVSPDPDSEAAAEKRSLLVHDRPASAEPNIPDGIEGCIGNTPLFKIKSLSDATGCEILAKAEVCYS